MDVTWILEKDGLVHLVNTLVRLLAAGILGGIIGYERESTHRPAGFRTHILVCVGAALVMVTSDYIFHRYRGYVNVDPARLGAQVISGIGFLGAGTIIREGVNVRGLTTAASLWAVSCVGLAAGIGFFEGAVAATVLIYLTLILLKHMEDHFRRKNSYRYLYIQSANMQGLVGEVDKVLDRHGVVIRSIEFIHPGSGDGMLMKYLVKLHSDRICVELADDLQRLAGVQRVYEE